MGYKGWKQMHQYGRRWAAEGFFSSIKRIFGETVRASSPEGYVEYYEDNAYGWLLLRGLAGGDNAQALLEKAVPGHLHAALLLSPHSLHGLQSGSLRAHRAMRKLIR
jgi:hypothetical protein